MDGGNSSLSPDASAARHFRTTHWSVVLAAGLTDGARSEQALESLCKTYWPPLYAYVRRTGHSEAEAQDLTQGFFFRLLDRNDIAKADQGKGRFRNFLLTALKRFLQDEWDKVRAEKRGGRVAFISFDDPNQFADLREPIAAGLDPAQEYDRRWAYSVLAQAWAELRVDYAARGQGGFFDALHPRLAGLVKNEPLAEVAARLGVQAEALKTAERRLMERFSQVVRNIVEQTVANEQELDDELRYLRGLFGGG